MTLATFLRIAVLLAVTCLLFWAGNGLLYLFNHPSFPGEASGAVIALLLLLVLFVWSAVRLLRHILHPHL
jgi:hypothetical protein